MYICNSCIETFVFKKNAIFAEKVAKIAENSDCYIEPGLFVAF
jgi:hypothetical protein